VRDGPQYKDYVAAMRLAAASSSSSSSSSGGGGSGGGKRRRASGASVAGSESESAGGDSGGEGGAAPCELRLGGGVLSLAQHRARVRERDAESTTRRGASGASAVVPSAFDQVVGAARTMLGID